MGRNRSIRVLIAFGIGAIVIGANGRSTVHSSLTQEADRRLAGHESFRDRRRGEEGWTAGEHRAPTSTSPARRSTPALARVPSPATCASTHSRRVAD